MQQGEDVTVLDVSGPLVIADYFVVATAKNHRHAVSMARELERSMKSRGLTRLNTSGIEGESPWILLDFDYVVVHLFEEEARSFYALEALWADAQKVDYVPPKVEAPAAAQQGWADDASFPGSRPAPGWSDAPFPGGELPGTGPLPGADDDTFPGSASDEADDAPKVDDDTSF